MSKTTDLYKKLRRDFLKRLTLAGGAVAFGAPASRLLAAYDEPDAGPAPPASRGYHETPHIRKYYDKARI